jgi:hypothetical protein
MSSSSNPLRIMRERLLDPAETASINKHIDNILYELPKKKAEYAGLIQSRRQIFDDLSAVSSAVANDVIHDIRHKYTAIFRSRHGRLPTQRELDEIMQEMRKRDPEIRSFVASIFQT